MPNSLDLITAFEGLTPQEARELSQRITTAVQKVIDRSDARRIRDKVIRRIMDTDGCNYPIARAKLAQQKRVMRKEIYRKVAETGCTPEAAFYLLHDERMSQEAK